MRRPAEARRAARRILPLLALLASLAPAAAQPLPATADSLPRVSSARADSLRDGRTPRGALRRALAVPGWGQIYNRHYWKLPLVYGGLGGMTFLALRLNHHYRRYRHAYLYVAYPDPRRYPEYQRDYERLVESLNFEPQPAALVAQRDLLRRNRDLSYLGIGLVYAIVALDAYVGAHLLDFDVSEDLSIHLAPLPGTAGASVRVVF